MVTGTSLTNYENGNLRHPSETYEEFDNPHSVVIQRADLQNFSLHRSHNQQDIWEYMKVYYVKIFSLNKKMYIIFFCKLNLYYSQRFSPSLVSSCLLIWTWACSELVFLPDVLDPSACETDLLCSDLIFWLNRLWACHLSWVVHLVPALVWFSVTIFISFSFL